MYVVMHDLLHRFCPEREVTVTFSDPKFVTAAVKAMLRRKNGLMQEEELMKQTHRLFMSAKPSRARA